MVDSNHFNDRFGCPISVLKFSENERHFLRKVFLICQKQRSLKTGWIVSSDLADCIAISTNYLKHIVRQCENKGGVRVFESKPGRYQAARKYEMSQKLFDALSKHYAYRRRHGRSMI